jgi:hypothetical protein
MPAEPVVFDPEKIQNAVIFAKPLSYAQGIDHVIISGQLAIEQSQPTNGLPGKILRPPS